MSGNRAIHYWTNFSKPFDYSGGYPQLKYFVPRIAAHWTNCLPAHVRFCQHGPLSELDRCQLDDCARLWRLPDSPHQKG